MSRTTLLATLGGLIASGSIGVAALIVARPTITGGSCTARSVHLSLRATVGEGVSARTGTARHGLVAGFWAGKLVQPCSAREPGTLPDAIDSDRDGWTNRCDNCIAYFNPNQTDGDGDDVGDACDACRGFRDQLDADSDGRPDGCDNCPQHANPSQSDCTWDGIGDVCALAQGLSRDCNGNSHPDECDITYGESEDCRGDGIPDECQVPKADCNANGVDDVCDLRSHFSDDCNSNATPDECEPQAFGAPGAFALEFDGVRDYVAFGNPAILNFSGRITLEAWIKLQSQSLSGERIVIAHIGQVGGNRSVFLRVNNGNYEVGARSQTARFTVPAADVGQWVHLAGVHDGTTWRLYRNGAQVATKSDNNGSVVVEGTDWSLGAVAGGTRAFGGSIDEVRIWNVGRAPGDIQQSMFTALGGDEPGLVAYWRLEEGTGTSAYDATSNSIVGTVSGARWEEIPPFCRAVRLVYLVPADRQEMGCYTTAIENAANHLRSWFHAAVGTGETFALRHPVEVVSTPHTASWYSTNPRAADQAGWFWENVLADAFELTGGRFADPQNIWVFYIDADPACGQITGGTTGVALLPANDLRGLTDQPNVPACPNQPPDANGLCRWIGGLGHELGHALGLPHPTACEDGSQGTPCPDDSLMWLGYSSYPEAHLLPTDVASLRQSPFFGAPTFVMPEELPFDCSMVAFRECQVLGDANGDWRISLPDYTAMAACATGVDLVPHPPSPWTPDRCRDSFDYDSDGDIDLADVGRFQTDFQGPHGD